MNNIDADTVKTKNDVGTSWLLGRGTGSNFSGKRVYQDVRLDTNRGLFTAIATAKIPRGATIGSCILWNSIQKVISVILQWIFILAAATSPIVLNVRAWKRLRRPPALEIGSSWQRRAAYLCLASNFFAYALPLLALIRNFILMNSGRPVSAEELVDWSPVRNVMTASVVLSLVLAALTPKYVRTQLFLSPLIPFLFWISLPVGIL